MTTPRTHAVFRPYGAAAKAASIGCLMLACSAVPVPFAGPRPWPQNAVDRELRRLSEQAVGETRTPPGPARRAREAALLARLQRLPPEESPAYRLDRALLRGHLQRSEALSGEALRQPSSGLPPASRLDPKTEAEARRCLAALAELGLAEARDLEPTTSATTAVSAAFMALADRVRPTMPLSPARAHFEVPSFRRAWARLGPRVAEDLGLKLEPPPNPQGGLEAAYDAIRAHQGARFRPWDTARLLLGLGSDDRALVFTALEAMSVLPSTR